MRFWQKIFLSSIILFTIAFDIGAYILITNSFHQSLEREADNSIREEAVIASSLETSLANMEQFLGTRDLTDSVLYTFIQPLAEYYEGQLVSLELAFEGRVVFSNVPGEKQDWSLELGQQTQITESRTMEGKRHMVVVSRIPDYSNLTLVYARDISDIDGAREVTIHVFILVSLGGVLIFGGLIFCLLRQFTKPIDELVATTTKIAAGEYQERVTLHNNDEFGQLGAAFNQMADAIEEKIDELTEQAVNKQIFIDDLAHEMKTPMTAILGYSSLLMQANLDDTQRESASSYINSSARRLSGLSERLLELANLTEGQVEKEEISVESLLEELVKQMEYSLSKREVILHTEYTVDTLNGDKTLLLAMIGNLVENAARASAPGKTIMVSIYEDSFPVIEVQDEGCGMPIEAIDKVMQPFYKVDKARTRENGGVGLGLSIVQRIAEVHHATVKITSKASIGTTVKVLFTT